MIYFVFSWVFRYIDCVIISSGEVCIDRKIVIVNCFRILFIFISFIFKYFEIIFIVRIFIFMVRMVFCIFCWIIVGLISVIRICDFIEKSLSIIYCIILWIEEMYVCGVINFELIVIFFWINGICDIIFYVEVINFWSIDFNIVG